MEGGRVYVSTGNSACMPKCRPKCTQCFAFEMLQKFILKHLLCKYSVLACSTCTCVLTGFIRRSQMKKKVLRDSVLILLSVR